VAAGDAAARDGAPRAARARVRPGGGRRGEHAARQVPGAAQAEAWTAANRMHAADVGRTCAEYEARWQQVLVCDGMLLALMQSRDAAPSDAGDGYKDTDDEATIVTHKQEAVGSARPPPRWRSAHGAVAVNACWARGNADKECVHS